MKTHVSFMCLFLLTFIFALALLSIKTNVVQAHGPCSPNAGDIDGDCFGNGVDNCPNDHGHGAAGCPLEPGETEAPTRCADDDGDGNCNYADQCPVDPGPDMYAGCPTPPVTPTPAPTDTPPATPTSIIVTAEPNNPDCIWSRSPNSGGLLYLRSEPNAASDPVSLDTVSPQGVIPDSQNASLFILGSMINDAGELWYRVGTDKSSFIGYVSAELSQAVGLGCAATQLDLMEALEAAACPASTAIIQGIAPLQLALLLESDDICEMLEFMVAGSSEFSEGIAQMTEDGIVRLASSNCVVYVAAYVNIAEQYAREGQKETFEEHTDSIPSNCDNWNAASLVQAQEPQPSDMSIETCVDEMMKSLGYDGIHVDRYQLIRDAFAALGLDMRDFFEDDAFNLEDACRVLRAVNRIGIPPTDDTSQADLLKRLKDECHFNDVEAITTLNAVLFVGLDINALLNSSGVDICHLQFPPDPSFAKVTIPEDLQGIVCVPDNIYLFVNHYEYLKATNDPLLQEIIAAGCFAIDEYIKTGDCIEYCSSQPPVTVTPTATPSQTPESTANAQPVTITETITVLPESPLDPENGTGTGGGDNLSGICAYLGANDQQEVCEGEQALGVFVQELEGNWHIYEITYTDGVRLIVNADVGEQIYYPSFSPDSRRLAYISVEGSSVSVKWFELSKPKTVHELTALGQIEIAPIAWDENNNLLVTIITDGQPNIHRLVEGISLSEVEIANASSPTAYDMNTVGYITGDGIPCLRVASGDPACNIISDVVSAVGAPVGFENAQCSYHSYSRLGSEYLLDCSVNGVRGIYWTHYVTTETDENGYVVQQLTFEADAIEGFSLGPVDGFLAWGVDGSIFFSSFFGLDEAVRILYSSGKANYLSWRLH